MLWILLTINSINQWLKTHLIQSFSLIRRAIDGRDRRSDRMKRWQTDDDRQSQAFDRPVSAPVPALAQDL